MPDRLPVLLTTAEAAILAGVSPATIRTWVHRGHLHAVAVNGDGHPLYDAADVRLVEITTYQRNQRPDRGRAA